MSHIMHFSLIPQADGTLNSTQHELTPDHIQDVVTRAHGAGKKVLVTVGGAGASSTFPSATSNTYRAAFITNLIQFMKTHRYDGIDIDWEPLPSSQGPAFRTFVSELRARLNTEAPGSLLTVTTMVNDRNEVVPVIEHIDQYNLQTYIISGPWSGWITWHNSPLFSGGHTFPSGGPLPSIEGYVNDLLSKGVPRTKIGVGSKFGGAQWSGGTGTPTGGVTAPRQSWSSPPAWDDAVAYHTIMDTLFSSSTYRWDADAKVPYLSIDAPGSAQDVFLSYENEQSITEKIQYIKSASIGGMILWELNLGYRPQLPPGERHPLLKAVKTAIGEPSATSTPTTSPTGQACMTIQGDANYDGKITLADFETWRRVFRDL